MIGSPLYVVCLVLMPRVEATSRLFSLPVLCIPLVPIERFPIRSWGVCTSNESTDEPRPEPDENSHGCADEEGGQRERQGASHTARSARSCVCVGVCFGCVVRSNAAKFASERSEVFDREATMSRATTRAKKIHCGNSGM